MTSGQDIAGNCTCRPDISPEICLACRIDNAITERQTAFQKHLDSCSNTFYGRKYLMVSKQLEVAERKIEELKKQVYPQWV